ncbi:hypothetical protein ABVT39_008008 [Epinephelus coioides]
MVRFCVCGGCTNSRLSGHRGHTFPTNRKSATFRAFYPGLHCSISNEEHGYLWSALTLEDYIPGDMMECEMGFRHHNRVRLRVGAVPSLHTAASSAPSSAALPTPLRPGHSSARRKRDLHRVLGDAASGGAPPAVLDDSDQEAFPMAPHHLCCTV